MNNKGSKLYDTIMLYDVLKNDHQSFSPFSYGLNVIKTLTEIYGEVDIINPIKLDNYDIFKNNLLKYIDEMDFNIFKDNFDSLPNNCINNENDTNYINSNAISRNPVFENIQRILIKMIREKNSKSLISEIDKKNIVNTMYLEENDNINFYNYALCYFVNPSKEKIKDIFKVEKAKIVLSSNRKDYLPDNVYESVALDPSWVRRLDDDQLIEVNNFVKQQLSSRNENNGGVDKGRVLSKLPAAMSSGSGFVDAILLAGVLATIVLIILIVYICLK